MSIIERAGLHHGTGSPAQLRPSWHDLLQRATTDVALRRMLRIVNSTVFSSCDGAGDGACAFRPLLLTDIEGLKGV